MRRAPRTLYAAVLLALALAVLLGAWFVAGWAEVRARQEVVRAAPRHAAGEEGRRIAATLRAELAELLARELERPYFHYQNLFRDPRASRGAGVTPSPLATGSPEPLVAGYFQIDAQGRTTTPTLNDEVPELSEPTRLAAHTQFRDAVRDSLAPELAPPARAPVAPVQVATAEPAPTQPASARRSRGERAAQVVTLDRSSYAQNSFSNSVYRGELPAGALDEGPPGDAGSPATSKAAPEPVTILVSPFEWRALPLAGRPALIAARHVETPDETFAQGFVVEGAALDGRLPRGDDDLVLALASEGAPAPGLELVAGWHLVATPSPQAMLRAAGIADTIARRFVLRFGAIGAVAALAAAGVVLLVARAERLARERSQFAAAAAHELRTPLAGLQLYGDMLADGLGDPTKQREYARRMSEEAARLGRVVANVLGFSQLERGDLTVSPAVAPLDDALREIAARAEPALDRAGAALALDVTPALTARFDRDALARIVGNLVDNAEKYGRGAADRTITITARALDDDVEVVISDHGPGIAPRLRDRLFRPFARGVPADGPAGLGLGLALSQSLARAMGGELSYRAVAGGGASFVLRLPRA